MTVSGGDLSDYDGTLNLAFDTPGITDTAGNSMTAGTPALRQAFVIDNTAPRLDTISGGSTYTNLDSLSFRATFDGPVVNVSAADFSIGGTTATVTNIVVNSSSDYSLTVSGGDLADIADTTVTIALSGSQDIADTAGNALTDTSPTGYIDSIFVNNTPPVGTFSSAASSPVSGDFTVNLAFTPQAGFADNIVGLTQSDIVISNATIQSFTLTTGGGGVTTGADIVVRPIASGAITLDLPANSIIDEAENQNPAATQFSITADLTPPTILAIERMTPFGEQTNADSLTFIVNFSEEVTNVDAADFAVNGTTTATVTGVAASAGVADRPRPGLDAPASSPSSAAYEVTVSGGDLASFDGTVGLDLAATPIIADDAGNALPTGEPATDQIYDVRNTAPLLASITRLTPTDATTNADSLTWRLTFAQIDGNFSLPTNAFTVTGTDASVSNVSRFSIGFDVTVSGGSPGNGLENLNGDVTLGLANTDFADDYGNVMDRTIPAGAEMTYTVDNIAPTVNLFKAGAGSPFTTSPELTKIFSEAVTGFTVDDLVVSGATLSGFRQNPGDRFFYVTVDRIADGPFTVDLPAGVATDAAGNPNEAATQFAGVFDTVAPTVVLSTSATQPVTGTFSINIDFSEDVTGLNEGDFTVVNGSTNNRQGSGSAYTMEIRPTFGAQGTLTIDLDADGVEDAAGFGNEASNQLSIAYDRLAPTLLSITRQTPLTAVINGSTTEVVFRATFSEDVVNVDVADWVIRQGGGGTIASVTPVSASVYDITYTLQNASGTIEMGITRSGDVSIEDTAGNALTNEDATGTTQTYERDTSAPIATGVEFVTTGGSPTASDTLMWAISFNEDMANASTDDFALTGTTATVTAVSTPQSTVVVVTASGGDLAGLTGNVTLGLSGSSDLSDAAGNPIASLINSGNDQRTIVVDNTGPTLAITGPAGPVSGAFTATFTFNEDVTGFVVGDISVGNGAASNFQATSATVYTATITPAADGTVTLDVAGAVAIDAAGNDNTAATQFSVTNDGTAPTLVAFARPGPGDGQTSVDSLEFLATFSENVINVTANDFVVTGTTATVTSVSSSLLPDPSSSGDVSSTAATASSLYEIQVSGGDLAGFNGVVGLDVAAGQDIVDTAGNAFAGGEPATDDTYTLDNTAPTVTSVSNVTPGGSPTGGASPTDADELLWLIFMSEPLSNLDASDILLTGTTATITQITNLLPNAYGSFIAARAAIWPIQRYGLGAGWREISGDMTQQMPPAIRCRHWPRPVA